jgi:hypothetical protein
MNWDDPAARAALIEALGPEEYSRRHAEHLRASTIATIAGHAIRPVASRYGRLFMVGDTKRAFRTLDEAKSYARSYPSAPFTCTLCGAEASGYGHEPWPLAAKGRCCDACNSDVILARIELMSGGAT